MLPRRVAFQALLTAFVITTAFCLVGSVIFKLFDTRLPAFRITGGVLVDGINGAFKLGGG